MRDYTAVFTETLIAAARRDRDIVAVTAAMPGSTGLLPFQREFPNASTTSASPNSTR